MEPICLITPPSAFLIDARVFVTLGILRVAAVLRDAGHPVEHLDLSGVENYLDAVEDHARRSPAAIFGLTATTPQMPDVAKIVVALRRTRPDAKLILGGPHVTLVNAARKREVKNGIDGRAHHAFGALEAMFDVLVAGDGEDAVFHAIMPDAPKLVDADDAASQLFMTDKRYDAMPFPARELVDMPSYHYTIDGVSATSLIGQLGCPYMTLTGDALVFTDRGFERIDAMVEGAGREETCIHGTTVRRHSINRVVATHKGVGTADEVIDEGVQPIFEVHAENGLSVKATPTHPFLVARDEALIWVRTSDLRIGDYLVMKEPATLGIDYLPLIPASDFPAIPPGGFQRQSEQMPSLLTPAVAWLTGYLIGDGCLPKDARPAVHLCVTNKTEDNLRRLVCECFGVDLSVNCSSQTQNMRHGWIHCRAAYQFFTEVMGIDPKDKLHVPPLIAASPKDVIEAFLEGLWAADGYEESPGRAYLTTISVDLAREVSMLLLMVGRVPSIQTVTGNGFKNGKCYRIGTFRNDRIPTALALYKSSKSGKWHWRTPRQPRTFLGIRRRTLRESELSHPLDVEGYNYVRVERIEAAGMERVYDLHVPGDHSFIANGVVVHNCSFCGGRNSAMLRRIRNRTVENILREVGDLHTEYGYNGFMFYDDELNVSRSMVQLMNGIADLQSIYRTEFRLRGFIKSNLFTDEQAAAMVRAGFRWILVGFESGSPRILDNIQKKATREQNSECMAIARRHGLKVKALMSIGHAGESAETVQQTKEWLLQERPDDFDCTVITTYPGTPYFDEAVEIAPGTWTYTAPKTKDRLHAYEVDFNTTAEFYKGIPGEYQSYVFTDYLSATDLVRLRDALERDVRQELGIPYNTGVAGVLYEHSMGQSGPLPPNILRQTREVVTA